MAAVLARCSMALPPTLKRQWTFASLSACAQLTNPWTVTIHYYNHETISTMDLVEVSMSLVVKVTSAVEMEESWCSPRRLVADLERYRTCGTGSCFRWCYLLALGCRKVGTGRPSLVRQSVIRNNQLSGSFLLLAASIWWRCFLHKQIRAGLWKHWQSFPT